MSARRARAIIARWLKPRAERVVFGHVYQPKRQADRTASRAVARGTLGQLALGMFVMLALTSCSTIGNAITCTVAHGCVTR